MYKIGDLFNIKVKIDDFTIIDDTLVITYIIRDIIITCGHCLPPNAIIPGGKILFTSGFDTDYESEELGIIQLNEIHEMNPKFKLLRTDYDILSPSKELFLLHQSQFDIIKPIQTFNFEQLTNLQFNELNFTNGFYWFHSIDKLINKKSKLRHLFDLSTVCIAYSEAKTKPIESEMKTIMKLGLELTTDKIFYLTEPSYSGSPIVDKNYIIGYHLGSTLGFKIRDSKIYWIGKLIYFKLIKLV